MNKQFLQRRGDRNARLFRIRHLRGLIIISIIIFSTWGLLFGHSVLFSFDESAEAPVSDFGDGEANILT